MQNNQTMAGDLNLPKIPGFISDKNGKYTARRSLSEEQIIKAAKALLKRKFNKGQTYTSPDSIKLYLMTEYANYEHEVFVCMFLDNQHHILSCEELFQGTIDSASIYPREVVKRALQLNAAAVIFVHNHPSGIPEPSQADKLITDKLKNALGLLDIRVLDHFIIGGAEQYSFAEHGLI